VVCKATTAKKNQASLQGVDLDNQIAVSLAYNPIDFLLSILDSQFLMKNPVIEDVSFVIYETVKRWLNIVISTREDFLSEGSKIDTNSLREIVLRLLSSR